MVRADYKSTRYGLESDRVNVRGSQPIKRLLSEYTQRLLLTQWSYQSFVDTGLNIPPRQLQNPED